MLSIRNIFQMESGRKVEINKKTEKNKHANDNKIKGM